MLERQPGAVHLTIARLSPQLLDQLEALGEPRRADGVSLGEQPTGRVRDDPAAVGVLTGHHELLRRAGCR